MNKSNIIILFFLLLMMASGFYALNLYNKVEEQKKRLAESEKALKASAEENAILQNRQDSVYRLISYYIKTNERYNNNDTLNNYIISAKKYGDSSLKIKNLSAYQQAYQLDRDGFAALANNDFEKALDKFTAADKASPSFHMSYEIARYLKSERNNFNDPRKQVMIKRQIVEKFNWKAPVELVNKLKIQTRI
jgi:tetratricopeptide (TPR) repeat protein